jgi:hypothetical protein
MRSLSAKPVSSAITSMEWRPCSISSRAASTRRFSTALAGDCPVSARNGEAGPEAHSLTGSNCTKQPKRYCRYQRKVEFPRRPSICATDCLNIGESLGLADDRQIGPHYLQPAHREHPTLVLRPHLHCLSLILALAGKSACLQRSARGSARNHEFGRERLDDFAALIDRPANNHGNTAIRL